MRKTGRTILSCIIGAALCIGVCGGIFTSENSVNATQAAAQTPTVQTAQSTLLSPASYEQYLSLTDTKDVAVTDDYMAIADGNVIYVYDKKAGEYRKYEHNLNELDPLKNTVTKLQFDRHNNLYFLDATYLYILDPAALTDDVRATETKFPCSTFWIQGDTLYYTDVKTEAQISKIELSDTELDVSRAVTLVDKLSSKPAIAYFEKELFFTDGGKHLYKTDPEKTGGETQKTTFIAALQAEILSMHVVNNILFCTDINGDFFAYSLPELYDTRDASTATPLAQASGGFSSLAVFGEDVYAVKNDSVRLFSLAKNVFTDYEIGNASSSVHRLNGATETHLTENTLFIADGGNSRISVYDVSEERFLTPINSTLPTAYLASTAETLLAANDDEGILYSLAPENYGEEIAIFNGFNGNVIGVANVYGKYYFATESNYAYVAEYSDEQQKWTLTETKKTSTRYPKLLCTDAYGYLYLAGGESVYRFTEAEFLSVTAEGTLVADDLPAYTDKILVDYEGGVYALSGGNIQKLNDTPTAFDLNEKLVYSDSATLCSFAFGVEENQTYLLYEENYIVKTEKLSLPTVKTIAVNGADKDIFSEESASFTVVKTNPDSLIIEFELGSLKDADVFPYLSYRRSKESLTALRIGQTDKYDLIAFFNETEKIYYTYLVLTESCETLPDGDYRTEYAESEQKTAYLTNALPLYKFPYLTDMLSVCPLTRGAEVTLLGEITKLDNDYYHVSYTDENGTKKTGYLPKSYLSPFSGNPPATTEKIIGAKESNKDAVWRTAYLLLGTAAICILIDYIILRPTKKD